MPTIYIALLRAVNLGPHNKIGMADLRQMVADRERTRFIFVARLRAPHRARG